MLGVSDGPRSGLPVAPAVRLGDRLAHPDAGLHGRAGFLHRGAGGAALFHRARDLSPHLDVLDQDILGLLRHRRGLRHHHAVPVRHQLEPLLRRHRQRPVAAVRLRGPDRLLPRGGVSRRAAVRAQAGAALGAFRRGADGGARHAVLLVLDPGGQQLDADAGRLRDHRRPLLPDGLVAGHLQPVFPYRLAHTVVASSSRPVSS